MPATPKTIAYGDSKWLLALNARTATPVSKFHAGLRYYFKIEKPSTYLDPLLAQLREVKIDILKFDDWLQLQHPGAPDISTAQLVELYYGVEAVAFIRSFI